MTKQNLSNRSDSATWYEPLLASRARCHLLGGSLSLALATGIAWIWFNADYFAKDERYSLKQIEQATQLVSEADSLRRTYADHVLVTNQNAVRKKEIEQWLPLAIDWNKASGQIDDLADEHNLRLTSLHRGDEMKGGRVAVQKATCEVVGSYSDLCKFLHEIANGPQPVWCDSIRIHRVQDEDAEAATCTASVSLRLPFAGPNTIAGKLLRSERPDA